MSRLKKIWHKIVSFLKQDGYRSFFKGRTPNKRIFCITGVDDDIIKMVLSIIQENFDLSEQQVLMLKPKDDLLSLYQSWYGRFTWLPFPDNMELEQTEENISEICGREMELSNCTIQNIIKRINKLNREKNGEIIQNWYKNFGFLNKF